MRKTILITAGGGAGSIALIKSLKGKYRVVAVDMDKHAAGLYFADRGVVLPQVKSPKYLNLLSKIMSEENVKFIVPSIDEELIPLLRYLKDNKEIYCLTPGEDFVKLCLNKLTLMETLRLNGLSCPDTSIFFDLGRKKLAYPFILKPNMGRGSRGFAIIKNKKDLDVYFLINNYKRSALIMQEYLEGVEYTVSVIVSKKGRVLSVIPKEIVKKEGITHIAFTRKNEKIEKLAYAIQEKFSANGPFNMQLIISKKTALPTIFEINPRISTTIALNILSGVNDVDILISDFLSESYKKPEFRENLVMIRYFDQFFVKQEDVK